MIWTTYRLKFHPHDEEDDQIYTHPQPLQVGDVIRPEPRARWFRVADLTHTREGWVARLAEGAASEAEAHNPKSTRA